MMLGYLLGRAGIDTVVLEKHADFLRDFRGDTVHPSTLRIMNELGLLEDFLKLPHSELHSLSAEIGTTSPALWRGKSEYPLGWPMPAREGAHHQLAIPDEPVERVSSTTLCFSMDLFLRFSTFP